MASSGPLAACYRHRPIAGLPLALSHLGGRQELPPSLQGGRWEEPNPECLLNRHPLRLAASRARPSTLREPALQRTVLLRMGGCTGVSRTVREAGSGGRTAGPSGSRSWRAAGSGDSAREAWHCAGEEGRKGRGLPGGWARHIITGEKLGQSLALSASV